MKNVFKHNRVVQAPKNIFIYIFSGDLYRAAPYILLLVLNEDVLFHWKALRHAVA